MPHATATAMATNTEIEAIVKEAFPGWRPMRSTAYREGLYAKLRSRLQGVFPSCPYEHGSAELDAWCAGSDEAVQILKLRKATSA